MCGITAKIGTDDAVDALLESLENLEYRGYDSAGLAIQNGAGISVTKQEGEVSELKQRLTGFGLNGSVGIGHTRWSTHGPPTDHNAHPHTSCDGNVAVVHNGIIENHVDLRQRLEAQGHEFSSDTDSEVVPHLIEEFLDGSQPAERAFRAAVNELEGSFALAAIIDGTQAIYATRSGSPLVLGIGQDANYLASDVPAFLDFSNNVVYPKDGDLIVLRANGYTITDLSGNPIDRQEEIVHWEAEDAKKDGFDHYMLKEIYEQPSAVKRTCHGRIIDGELSLDDFPAGKYESINRVQLLACGTSYHAGLYAERLLADAGIPVQTFLASEYAVNPPPVDENTLTIGVTQSGETADTLEALRCAHKRGARIAVVTNVVGSTAAREFEDTLFIRSGPEIGVAATKTFTSQVAALILLGERLTRDITGSPSRDSGERLKALEELPELIKDVLTRSSASTIADRYLSETGHFFIGRGCGYPVALEGALKFKEITYKHAEGFPAGELKHGPLALVSTDTPVFAVCTGRCQEKVNSNIREIQTRGGSVIAIVPANLTAVMDTATESLTVPATHPDLVGILANIHLQLIAYHAAVLIGRSIDKPRNLAKSVTVE